ncbi:hypothetical protein K501DRAFT_276315 [Backusella circina FSU 941]|nr:hypothetical protein K501DRAFT_276315 [Backusella circina FSU 941]
MVVAIVVRKHYKPGLGLGIPSLVNVGVVSKTVVFLRMVYHVTINTSLVHHVSVLGTRVDRVEILVLMVVTQRIVDTYLEVSIHSSMVVNEHWIGTVLSALLLVVQIRRTI